MLKKVHSDGPALAFHEWLGIRGPAQVKRDLGRVLSHLPRGDRFTFNLGSAGLLRPDLSLPAYAGRLPRDGVAPIFNFFDRHAGGRHFRSTVRRSRELTDWRGGRLSYDEHDGTDFVCPPGSPLVAAAPGIAVAVRDTWLRGGLTLCVDHGGGLVTQYTHLSKVDVAIGERVERGQRIAWSGVSGFDMTQFFPWVPPHVHFMSWLHGRPVDPYRVRGEDRAGGWAHGNDPVTSGPLAGDPSPSALEVHADECAIDALISTCKRADIVAELERAPDAAARVAILEDSMHHDRDAWPASAYAWKPRRRVGESALGLTLPLSAELYRSARAADTRLTRPRN